MEFSERFNRVRMTVTTASTSTVSTTSTSTVSTASTSIEDLLKTLD